MSRPPCCSSQSRARKGGALQPPQGVDESSSAAANTRIQCGADHRAPPHGCDKSALPGACLEVSDSGEDVQEQQPLVDPRSSAPQPLRRLRRLTAPAAAAARAETAAAVGELAASLAGLSVASAAGRLPDTASTFDAVTGVCNERPASTSSSHAVGARLDASGRAGLSNGLTAPPGEVDSAQREGATGSFIAGQQSPMAGARQQRQPRRPGAGPRAQSMCCRSASPASCTTTR